MTAKLFTGPDGKDVNMSEAIRRTYDKLGNDPPVELVRSRVKMDYGFDPSSDMLRTVLRRHKLGGQVARGLEPKMKKDKPKNVKIQKVITAKNTDPSIEELLTTLEDVTRQQEALAQLRHELIVDIEGKLKEHAAKLEELEKPIASPRPVTVAGDSSVVEVG